MVYMQCFDVQLKAFSQLRMSFIKLVASPNRKSKLGNQAYMKRCTLYSRTQCSSSTKNQCMGNVELLYSIFVCIYVE